MITHVYKPQWIKVQTEQGIKESISFVAEKEHVQYAGKLSYEKIALVVSKAQGDRGSCFDYINNTHKFLKQNGLQDKELEIIINKIHSLPL